MKGTKCPYCESPIPMFHGLLKQKKLSKEHEDRNRKFKSPGSKLNCLRCEHDFEIKISKMAFLLLMISSTLTNIFTTYISKFLGIEVSAVNVISFLVLIFQILTTLFVLMLMLKFLNVIFITTWPIREKSE